MRMEEAAMRIMAGVGSLILFAGVANAQPFVVQGPGVDPNDFRVTVFASGLNFPYGMQTLSDGSLLVATSDPIGGITYFNSTGVLLRLVDADGDGAADGPGTVLYSGLPGPLTTVRQAGGFAFVVSAKGGSERISFLRQGKDPGTPYVLEGSMNFSFPDDWEHTIYALAVRQAPDDPDAHELFFNVGSSDNDSQSSATVGLSGLITGTLNGASIYKVTVQDSGGTPVVSGLTQIAAGLRNAAGIAFEAASGDLYLEDNGIDGLIDREEPLSADELNRIPAADIGCAVEDFGFPDTYIEYRSGTQIGTGGILPLVAFQPIPPPSGSEAEGPAEITFSPSTFPSALSGGVFVGFHGRFVLAGLANEENPFVFYNLTTGEYFHFISNDEPDIGHLDGLLATSDSLFVSDLDSAGALTGTGGGVIYQIKAVSRKKRRLGR